MFEASVPLGMNTRHHNAWMIHGGGLQLVREFLADYNVVNCPAGNTGAQMGGWFRKEINSVEDLKGLKFRIAGMGGQILSRLGVVPQVLAG
ncbi:ABC transporter substrate-binding protein, partial [Acinetobacter baumannii]